MSECKNICVQCGKEFVAHSKKAKYCSVRCKWDYYNAKREKVAINKICPICGKKFIGNNQQKYCSHKCAHIAVLKQSREGYHKNKSIATIDVNGKEGYDFVTCPICGKKYKQITIIHFRTHGFETMDEVYAKYPDIKLTCQKLVDENLVGDNNPMSAVNATEEERKRCSIYSLEYWKYHKGAKDDEEAFTMRQHYLDTVIAPQRINWVQATHTLYWTRQGYTEEEAKQIIHDKYVSNGLDFYVRKYGEEEGTKRYNERILAWQDKMFQGKNRSSIADSFFDIVAEMYPERKCDFYYGENEYHVRPLGSRVVYPDFLDIKNKKIIEFFGDYWHMNPEKYDKYDVCKPTGKYAYQIWEHDKERHELLRYSGYDVLIVWEDEVRNFPDVVLEEVCEYLG